MLDDEAYERGGVSSSVGAGGRGPLSGEAFLGKWNLQIEGDRKLEAAWKQWKNRRRRPGEEFKLTLEWNGAQLPVLAVLAFGRR